MSRVSCLGSREKLGIRAGLRLAPGKKAVIREKLLAGFGVALVGVAGGSPLSLESGSRKRTFGQDRRAAEMA